MTNIKESAAEYSFKKDVDLFVSNLQFLHRHGIKIDKTSADKIVNGDFANIMRNLQDIPYERLIIHFNAEFKNKEGKPLLDIDNKNGENLISVSPGYYMTLGNNIMQEFVSGDLWDKLVAVATDFYNKEFAKYQAIQKLRGERQTY